MYFELTIRFLKLRVMFGRSLIAVGLPVNLPICVFEGTCRICRAASIIKLISRPMMALPVPDSSFVQTVVDLSLRWIISFSILNFCHCVQIWSSGAVMSPAIFRNWNHPGKTAVACRWSLRCFNLISGISTSASQALGPWKDLFQPAKEKAKKPLYSS